MSERLLPEAIRGSWYLLPEEGALHEALEEKGQLLAFHLDGTFIRYTVDASTKQQKEQGDYTFDGDFLILRGRNTDTFRVHVERDWCWFLEAKKKNRRLYRGLLDADDFFEMGDEESREIGMLPMRVQVQCPYDDETDAVFDLVHEPKDGESACVGCFSVEHDPETKALWVGLAPVATNLDVQTWEKVIRKSYLDMHLGKPDDVGWVSLEILGRDGQVHEFDSRS